MLSASTQKKKKKSRNDALSKIYRHSCGFAKFSIVPCPKVLTIHY